MSLAHMGGWTGGAWMLLSLFLAVLLVGVVLGFWRLARGRPGERAEEIGPEEHAARLAALGGPRGRSSLALVSRALAIVGLAGTLVVAAVAPGRGHGFMHMMGGMGPMMMMMTGAAGRSGSPPVSGAREVRIVGREFSFEPHRVRLRAGETLNVVFDNRGMMFHTLTIGGLGLDLRVNGGDSIAGSMRPEKPGTYSFICAVSGHAEAGMRGRIEVE